MTSVRKNGESGGNITVKLYDAGDVYYSGKCSTWTFIHPITCLVICPIICPVSHPITHSVTNSVNHPVTHPVNCLVTCLVTRPVIRLVIRLVNHPIIYPIIHPIICPIMRPITHPIIRPVICPLKNGTRSHPSHLLFVPFCHCPIACFFPYHHLQIVRATPLRIPKWVSCGLYKNSGSDEVRLMGWSWLDTIRNGKGAVGWDRRVSPNMVEYPKRIQLGCPLSLYYVYMLCYIYCRVFDHAAGTHAYRRVHNFVITCVRNIIPWSFWECLGSHLGSLGRK